MLDFDLVQHLVLTLGSNRGLWKHIDTVYSKRELSYYKAYKNSIYFNDIAKATKSTEVESYVNKLIGISEYCTLEDNYEDMLYIIKKGYNKLYRYFKNTKRVSVPRVALEIMDDKFLDSNDECVVYSYFIVMLYLSIVLGVELEGFDIEGLLGNYIDSFYRNLTGSIRMEHLIKEHKGSIDKLYSKLNIDTTEVNKNMVSLNLVIENMIERATISKLKDINNVKSSKKEDILKASTVELYTRVRDEMFLKGFYKYVAVFNQWLTVLGVDEQDLMANLKVNKDTFDMFLGQIHNSKYAGQLEEGQEDICFAALVCIYNLVYNYKSTKKLYLDNSKDELYSKIALKEDELKEKEAKIQEDLKRIEKLQLKAKSTEDALKERIKELEGENKALKGVIKDTKSYKKEVVALREYMYLESLKNANVEVIEEEKSIKDIEDYLKEKKITVVGGHPNWVKNLKDRLPGGRYIDAGNVTVNVKGIINSDIVVINTTVLGHKVTERIMDDINASNVDLVYINNEINIDKVLSKIYNSTIRK